MARSILDYSKSKEIRRFIILLSLLYFIPWVVMFYIICGAVDLVRNQEKNRELILQYFLGNGTFTWFLSPLDLVIDILCLPYWNKGIFKLYDLPKEHQHEILSVIHTMKEDNIITQLDQYLTEGDREMIFFKWYDKNIDNPVKSADLYNSFKYIRTIGVSVFNRKKSTSKHFGPFRMTYRVLYNLNAIDSSDIYIEVGAFRHYWNQDKLFIFDDTLRHQSINNSIEKRYCAFIDIERPSYIPFVLRFLIQKTGVILNRVNHVFYKKWKFIN